MENEIESLFPEKKIRIGKREITVKPFPASVTLKAISDLVKASGRIPSFDFLATHLLPHLDKICNLKAEEVKRLSGTVALKIIREALLLDPALIENFFATINQLTRGVEKVADLQKQSSN